MTFQSRGVLQQGQRHQSALSGPWNLNWPAELPILSLSRETSLYWPHLSAEHELVCAGFAPVHGVAAA